MRQIVVSSVLAVGLVFGAVLPALAWKLMGEFSGQNWWAVNKGEKWGQIFRDDSAQRYLDADASNFYWDSSRTSKLKAGSTDPAIVFHIFKQNSNCGQLFDFTGHWWVVNFDGAARKLEKWADCSPFTSGPENVLRIYLPRSSIVAGERYGGGGRFRDTGRGLLDGEVTYDTYYGSNEEFHTKWCFGDYDGMYNPNAEGKC